MQNEAKIILYLDYDEMEYFKYQKQYRLLIIWKLWIIPLYIQLIIINYVWSVFEGEHSIR